MRRFLIIIMAAVMLTACTGLPEGVQPVKGFELNRYLGKWYEIARLDHSFERGLNNVSASYSMREDGGIRVINKGFSTTDKRWKEAEGRAYFMHKPSEAYLKVSFFGPFYGSYSVFELDKEHYQYAFVSGYNTDYLWLLSRSPTVSEKLLSKFINKSRTLGFDTDKLIFVQQEKSGKP